MDFQKPVASARKAKKPQESSDEESEDSDSDSSEEESSSEESEKNVEVETKKRKNEAKKVATPQKQSNIDLLLELDSGEYLISFLSTRFVNFCKFFL